MKKRIVLAGILMLAAAALAGCARDSVRIRTGSVRVADLVLSVRAGYEYADDLYEIQDTEEGYDIIIHLKEGRTEP